MICMSESTLNYVVKYPLIGCNKDTSLFHDSLTNTLIRHKRNEKRTNNCSL